MAEEQNENQNNNEMPNPSPAELLGAFTETAMLVSTLEQNTQNFHSQMVIKGIVAELVNKVDAIKKRIWSRRGSGCSDSIGARDRVIRRDTKKHT